MKGSWMHTEERYFTNEQGSLHADLGSLTWLHAIFFLPAQLCRSEDFGVFYFHMPSYLCGFLKCVNN